MKNVRQKVTATLLVAVLTLSFSGWTGSRMGTSARPVDFPAEAAVDDRTIVIDASNQVLAYRCNGAAVVVNGNHNTITLSGTCSSLAVRGNKNWISLEAPTVVTDSGNNNVITLPGAPATATTAPTITPRQPTNTPPPPTRTQPAPTRTQAASTGTPFNPTHTPLVPTDTPPPPTQTPLPDTEAPAVRWVAPALAGERYDLREGEQVLLEAEATDNVGVAEVRFIWWDAAGLQYVTLGTLLQPPYRLPVDAGALNPEWNQVFVLASDQAQNNSASPSIWLYKPVAHGSQPAYQIFLPLTEK